ncbi:MAG: 50S ribosomal protein L15 [Chlorobi bacterium]|nr:50S ribosomal protein L15 [Chlorobiota bacterium]
MSKLLSNLKPAEGSVHKEKRIGRGEGSKKGGTSGRGHKGAKSRSGYSRTTGFEGGQMPLYRRVPKFGFTNVNRKEYVPLNLATVQEWVDKGIVKDTLDWDMLYEMKFIKKTEMVKLLGKGELKAPVTIRVNKASKKAVEAVEKAGGKVELI